jgi:hypothetical protein
VKRIVRLLCNGLGDQAEAPVNKDGRNLKPPGTWGWVIEGRKGQGMWLLLSEIDEEPNHARSSQMMGRVYPHNFNCDGELNRN